VSAIPNTSGTYNWNPTMGADIVYSYGLCGIRPTQLIQEHFETARMATNLMMAEWGARGVNLWAVDLQTITLQQGCATYAVPSTTITMLDTYISFNGSQPGLDRLILPISRSEYASLANKNMQGFPTSFWFNRLLSPVVNLWPVPDGNQTHLRYYRLRQNQDSVMQNGTAVEMPIYYQNAFSLGLAWRLALTYAPDKTPMLKPLADEAYEFASTQNTEAGSLYVSPMIGGYFR
jgi:hypothetical protein